MIVDGNIRIRVGSVELEIDSGPMAVYHGAHVDELKRAVVQACLAMDNPESRALAQKVEGAM